jgi:hypothetical protein
MKFARGRYTRVFLILVLVFLAWGPVIADEIRLKVRAVPTEITLWHGEQQIPRDHKRGTFLMPRPSEPLELELRASGHQSETVQLTVGPEQTLVTLPEDESEVIYLRPLVQKIQFETDPTSKVYLQTGEDKQFLGMSSEPVFVPLGAGTGGSALVLFEAAGYRTQTIEMKPDQYQADRLPTEGTLVLPPRVPLVSPVIRWLAARKSLSVTILIVLTLGILVLLKRLLQDRARST